MKSLIKKQEGFTLIEIVLVLAIAAFIILLVFLALQGANKSRRDTARKEEASKVASDITAYEATNSGSSQGFTCNTANTDCSTIKDVDTGIAPISGTNASNTPSPGTGVLYSAGGSCTNNTVTAGTVWTHFAVSYWNEVNNSATCVQG